MLFWLGTKARRTTFGLGTAGEWLGTDRRRIRRRTATIGVFGFATVQSVRAQCARRHQASTPVCPTSGCLCGRLLVALVESVLRPGGWENMCRLMCHCVRHIGLDNKHGRSVEAIHSFLSRWTAGTGALCQQQEPSRTARRARWGARTVRGASRVT